MNRNFQTEPDLTRTPILPEKLARKLVAIRNDECPQLADQISKRPRLVEMLWFVQAMSLRPGGLRKFCETLLAEFPERLGTKTMREVKGHNYTTDQKVSIWSELPEGGAPAIDQENPPSLGFLEPESPIAEAARNARNRTKLKATMAKFDGEKFVAICRRAVLRALPEFLAGIWKDDFESFEFPEPWAISDPVGAILEFMDRHAAHVQERLAMTEVAKLVFDALDFALAEKVMVRIEGASRFGKTEAMAAWCDMRPGLARLVRVPCSNSMPDFLSRIAEALGVQSGYGIAGANLKSKVEYIIRQSGLFLVMDEGAFLIPQNYSATSAPNRLNWVRTEIVDRNLPLAIAVTPQAFKSGVARFIKKTGYTMEQFFGRNFLTRVLPLALTEQDMISVARIHFPELDLDALGYIANEARLSQNYLQAVEAVAKYCRYLANREKRRIGLKHIETAVAQVLPRREASGVPAPSTDTYGRGDTAERVGRLSRAVTAPLKASHRSIESRRGAAISATDFDSCSLRGAGLERTEADLVSA